MEKPKEKSALERLSREKPFPELSELLRSLPSEISSQIAVTSTLNDLLARLMITQGRSLAELKLWLADPQLWKGSKNPGGFLTSLLKRQLENGYTPKEPTPTPPAFNSVEYETLKENSTPMPQELKELRERLRAHL